MTCHHPLGATYWNTGKQAVSCTACGTLYLAGCSATASKVPGTRKGWIVTVKSTGEVYTFRNRPLAEAALDALDLL